MATRLSKLGFTVKIHGKDLSLVSNNELLLYRSKTFHSKEPETNLWIEKMPPDGVFFDIGANVGIFTMLASRYCRKVYAFEPVALNYSILTQNLMVNKLDSNAFAYCIAVGEKTSFDTMRLSSDVVGSAYHTFGRNIDACHHEFAPVFKQGALSISLDDLVYKYNFECPTYLKVDVDGNEHLVIKGAEKLLKDPKLKSILIELNKQLSVDMNLVETIKQSGFILKEVGPEADHDGMKIGNLIFYRT